MGQLIKLQDYISRYEQDIFTYPSRFVRLKKQQWVRTRTNWENEGVDAANLSFPQSLNEWEEENENDKPAFFKKLTDLFKHNQKTNDQDINQVYPNPNEEDPLQFTASFSYMPETIDELKRQFLDQLYRFQLKWASSTILEKSFIHSKYYFEENVKFFLQRFPDTFLVLYRPVFLLKK